MGSGHSTLILASGSPRRAQILSEAGINFEVVAADIDEDRIFSRHGRLSDLVQQVALAKAKSIADAKSGTYVIGADTIVVLDDHMLGKPESPRDAIEMLQRLSGRSHVVMTGVAVIGEGGDSHTSYVATSVAFRELGESEIAEYVATGSPMDKAGSYGIQDNSLSPASSYDECYLNVVGLPMCATSELLEKSGVPVPGKISCPGHRRPDEEATRVRG